MNKLAIGDRVAAYALNRLTGVVKSMDEDNIEVWCDNDWGGFSSQYHPKQLRKLKPKAKAEPKKARERVCRVDKHDSIIGAVLKGQDKGISAVMPDRLVFVKEVLPGEITVTRDELAKALDYLWANFSLYGGTKEEQFFKALGFKESK